MTSRAVVLHDARARLAALVEAPSAYAVAAALREIRRNADADLEALLAIVDDLARERDAARAETAKVREVMRLNTLDCEEVVNDANKAANEWRKDANRYARELAAVRADLERVAGERDAAREEMARLGTELRSLSNTAARAVKNDEGKRHD